MRLLLLGLGANRRGAWGTPAQTLTRTLGKLQAAGLQPVAISRLYRTAPIGGPAQDDYLNAVVQVLSDLAPTRVLAAVKTLERSAGRRPRGHWMPRPLDIDILDDAASTLGWRRRPAHRASGIDPPRWRRRPGTPTGQLVLPHPRLHLRAFVLVPLLDIAPQWRHPVLGRTAHALLQALASQRRSVRPSTEQWPRERRSGPPECGKPEGLVELRSSPGCNQGPT